MAEKLNIVGIAGSLRSGSYNRSALKLALDALSDAATCEIIECRDFPPFDGDEFAKGFPPQVAAARERIRAADGVVIACPEYNFSIPGVLKNAIDWISRGADQPFNWKPVTIFSATMGAVGGARAQYDLRKVMLFMNAMTMPKPETFIGLAQNKFDEAGNCTDENTKKFLGDQMKAFIDWIGRVKRMA